MVQLYNIIFTFEIFNVTNWFFFVLQLVYIYCFICSNQWFKNAGWFYILLGYNNHICNSHRNMTEQYLYVCIWKEYAVGNRVNNYPVYKEECATLFTFMYWNIYIHETPFLFCLSFNTCKSDKDYKSNGIDQTVFFCKS